MESVLSIRNEKATKLSELPLHVRNAIPAKVIGLDQMGYVADMSAIQQGTVAFLLEVTTKLPSFIIPRYKAREHDPL